MILPRSFYERPTVEVARDLLGKILVREFTDGKRLAGKVVEVEAYDGPEDLACHAAHGRTKRTEVMFGPAGHAYIYLIYGIYHCLNIVAEKPGAAVLIRALEPSFAKASTSAEAPADGSEVRSSAEEHAKIASGPGKLCQWMKIDKDLNGWDLTKGERLWLEPSFAKASEGTEFKIEATSRIGVDYAGEWAEKPWRFHIKDNSSISRS